MNNFSSPTLFNGWEKINVVITYPHSVPIVANKRKMEDYTVEDIAL